jgi:flagellar biosynthesis/type III secretory pathway M-ring protein FliF/YscJ
MRALGISLILVGLALVCGALVLWPRASRTEDTEEEDKTESRKEGKSAEPEETTELRKEEKTESREKTETAGMADLLQRLNETPDDDPFK